MSDRQPEERTDKRTETHACDLISRQAALKIVAKHIGVDGDRACLIDVGKTYGEIYAMPSAQPEQRWIPWDSGRLPDDSGTYIITAYDGFQERVTFAKYQKRLKRWELTGARAYWRVLAWMPLPEPYRGDAE